MQLIKKLSIILGFFFVFITLTTTSYASDGTTVDLMPLISIVLTILSMILTAIIGLVGKDVRKWFKEETGIAISSKVEDWLETLVIKAKKEIKNEIEESKWNTVEFDNKVIAKVVQYATEKIPEVAKGVVSVSWVEDKVEEILDSIKE